GPKMSCSLRGSQRIAMIAANPRETSAISRYEVLARGMDRLKEDESVVAKVLLSPEILGGMAPQLVAIIPDFRGKSTRKHTQTDISGVACTRLRVYACPGRSAICSASPTSTSLPRYMTAMRVER